jgi:heptosyltransferase-2
MKILVIQQKMIGDVLTSSILFEALRKNYPESELHYLIYPHTKPVVEHNPFIDKIIEYDSEIGKDAIKFLKFLKLIRKESYSAVIDIYSKISSAIIAKYSGAPLRLGFHKHYTHPFYTRTFNYKDVPETKAGLAIENRMQLLKAFGKNFPRELKPKLYISSKEKASFRKKLVKQGVDFDQPLIMCGVLGSSSIKTYPKNYMASLLDTLIKEKTNGQILFNYLPWQKTQAQDIYNQCNSKTQSRIFIDIYEKSLKGFIMNCANCDLYFGNEGGAANIMKALNKPTFSIHSPQIKKNYWAIYENGKNTRSVHLEDYSSIVFKKTTNNVDLKPEYFSKELLKFMHFNLKNPNQRGANKEIS